MESPAAIHTCRHSGQGPKVRDPESRVCVRYADVERLRCRSPRGGGLLSLVCPRESSQREGHPEAA